jgi:hypothetical protein
MSWISIKVNYQKRLGFQTWPKTPGLTILTVNGLGKLVLLHNVSYLQENLFCSESKVLGLCREGNQADVFRVDSKSATGSLELSVPAWRDLKNLQPGSDLDSLVVPDQNPSTAHFKNSMWIPSLVSVAILEADSLIPSVLFPCYHQNFKNSTD